MQKRKVRCMKIEKVEDVLATNFLGSPTLNVLTPDKNNYNILLFQPKGDIEADANGVRNRNRQLAFQQYGKFLEDAKKTGADLVVTPEYSMPWNILKEIIENNNGPEYGKLWALGCESIKLEELENFKNTISSSVTVIFEQLELSSSKFISPLTYVFKAPSITDETDLKTVMLVQFKTHPMSDADHFEINRMQKGTCIYKFCGYEQISLLSLICADAIDFRDELASTNYDRALILHIQLNPKPRHQLFLGCRERLLKYEGDETELLCLNWASNVVMHIDGQVSSWDNIAGSAWYLKTNKFDSRDQILCNNHKLGLYYTWLKPHYSHALFFNYNPATYLLTATKVFHLRVEAAVSRRRGPQLNRTCIWDNGNGKWIEQEKVEDNFSTVVHEIGTCHSNIKVIAEDNPFNAERILALCTGAIKNENKWYNVENLDSCTIEQGEIIKRITFAQDTDDQAKEFRISRLLCCEQLWNILKTENLPRSIHDLKEGFCYQWSHNSPNQNIISDDGKLATVIYAGETRSKSHIDTIIKTVEGLLFDSFRNLDEISLALKRFHVLYRDGNAVMPYQPYRNLRYDQTGNEHPFDIGRVE